MKNKSIKIKLIYDNETHDYKAVCRTDVRAETVRNAFDSLMFNDGNIIPSKFKHTRAFIFRAKMKSFARRTAYVFKAFKKACSKDFAEPKGNSRYLNAESRGF